MIFLAAFFAFASNLFTALSTRFLAQTTVWLLEAVLLVLKIFMTFLDKPPRPIKFANKPITSGINLANPNSIALATPATEPAAKAKIASINAGMSIMADSTKNTITSLIAMIALMKPVTRNSYKIQSIQHLMDIRTDLLWKHVRFVWLLEAVLLVLKIFMTFLDNPPKPIRFASNPITNGINLANPNSIVLATSATERVANERITSL